MTKKIDEKLALGYIHFTAILEIVGKPKDHVEATFKEFIEQIKKNIKYEVVSVSINDAIEVEGSENLYSSFAELEVLVKNMGTLFDFCFECMPASVEILAPAQLSLKPNQASAAVNDLIARIHQVDMQSKQLTQQTTFLAHNLRIMIENAVVIFLAQKPHTIEPIAKAVGAQPEQLKKILEAMIADGKITESNGVYGVAGRNIKNTPKNADDAQQEASGNDSKKSPSSESVINVSKEKAQKKK